MFSFVMVGLQLNVEVNEQFDDECVSVIVTGSAAKDGRAVLMKNRDTGDTTNKPVYYSSGVGGTYAYVMVNSYWMGINERA